MLDSLVKVLGNTNGRDKVSKLIQYTSRSLTFYLSKDESLKDWSTRFNGLFKGAASARKLTRLFKSLEFVNNFANFIINNQLTERIFEGKFDFEALLEGIRKRDIEVLNLVAQFFLALYFFFDHFVWFISIGFMKGDVNMYKKKSMKYWFIGLLLSVISDVIVFVRLSKRNSQIESEIKESDRNRNIEAEIKDNEKKLDGERKNNIKRKFVLVLNCIRNLGDMGVSSHGSEMAQFLDEGLLGICGSLSAIIGFYQAWPEKPK